MREAEKPQYPKKDQFEPNRQIVSRRIYPQSYFKRPEGSSHVSTMN